MIRLSLFVLLGILSNIAWAQADTAVGGMNETEALIGLAKGLGPYGTLLVILFFAQRVKVPAVPLRVDGPVTITLSGPVGRGGPGGYSAQKTGGCSATRQVLRDAAARAGNDEDGT